MIVPNKVKQRGKLNAPSVNKNQNSNDDWESILKEAESSLLKTSTKTTVAPMDNPARHPQIKLNAQVKAAPVIETKQIPSTSSATTPFYLPPPPPPPPLPPVGTTQLPMASTVLIRDAEMAQHVMEKRAQDNRIVTKSAIKRIAGGDIWEDKTMADWDKNDYRLFVGNLGYEASDDLLVKTFSHYPSFKKARVVRDKKTGRCKGYGFLSFGNADDYIKATREFNGKYVGNRPIKLTRSKWERRQLSAVRKETKRQTKLKKMLNAE